MRHGTVSIRLAEQRDAATLHAGLMMIAEAVGAPDKVTSSPDDLQSAGFGDDPAFVALLAEQDGAFAGMSLFFRSFSTWRGKPGIYLQDLVVAPAFRGSGVANLLLQATARHGADHWNARYLRLSVDADNQVARRFYELTGLGWQRSEAIHAAYDDDFTALVDGKVTARRHET